MFRKTLAASLLLVVSIASAHHSFQATFTSDRTISVEGVVTDYRFKNPHILIYLDVTDDDGVVTNWMSEGGAATLMRRRGWDRNTISKGESPWRLAERYYGDGTLHKVIEDANWRSRLNLN